MKKLNVMSSDDKDALACVMQVSSFTSQQEAKEELLSSLQHKHRGETKLVHTPSGQSAQNTVVHSVLGMCVLQYCSTPVCTSVSPARVDLGEVSVLLRRREVVQWMK